MIPLSINSQSRVMVIAPHPDDESLAAGILLQAAAARGASVCIVFMTFGENNAWPQRVIERRWRIGRAERKRWGNRRRQEALAALATLGVSNNDILFLQYPDQEITRRLIRGDDEPARRLCRIIDFRRPTILVSPSLADTHADHSATGVYVRQALALLPEKMQDTQRLEYLVHTRGKDAAPNRCLALPAKPTQRDRKRRAIACHRSQTRLHPVGLEAFADRPEHFFTVAHSPSYPAPPGHPIYQSEYRQNEFVIKLSHHPTPGAFGPATLLLAANRKGISCTRMAMSLPGYPTKKLIAISDSRSGRKIGQVCFTGGPFHAEIRINRQMLEPADQLFAAIKRRFGFFDAAGWLALPAPEEKPAS